MKTVVIYARVSSEQQAQQATVASQLEALRERVAKDGHQLSPEHVYIDDGVSGTTLVRDSLERLRDRIAEGRIDLLYVHSPDRLARKYAYQVLLLDEFRQRGVSVVFLNQARGESAEDELLVQVQGMIAEYERAKILERSRRGKLFRARQGLVNPIGKAPYGYLYVRKSDAGAAQFQVLLHEAKIVRWLFRAVVHEQMSINKIVRKLNEDGTPTKRGGRWHCNTVLQMLRNPAYIGKAAFNRTQQVSRVRPPRPPRHGKKASRGLATVRRPEQDWILIDVPAIVSKDLFDAAAAQLDRNIKLSTRNAIGKRYLLQGLTVCSRCSYGLYGRTTTSKGTTYRYYRCFGRDALRHTGGGRAGVCTMSPVRAELLDDHVWRSACELLQSPERLTDEWSRRLDTNKRATELRTEREEAARRLAVHERSRQRLIDAYEVGAVDLLELTRRSSLLQKRIELARAEVEKAERILDETVHLRAIIAHLNDFGAAVQRKVKTLTWEERKKIVRTLIAKVEVDEDDVTIVYRLQPPHRSDQAPIHEAPARRVGNCDHNVSRR